MKSVFSKAMSLFIGLMLLSVTATQIASAQSFRGGINGTITDQSGAAIPEAKVRATDDATDAIHETVSSSSGSYSFQDLPLGTYTIAVSCSGFQTTKAVKVPITAGVIYSLPLKLSVAQTATTVEVDASGVALDTSTPVQTTVLPVKTVQDIPMNGRDFTQMIGLAPGFAGYSLGGFGSVNGTRGNQVNWQIDGADNNDLWHNIPAVNQGGIENIAGVTLPIDSVEEFSLQTQSGAEIGRNPGGTVNLVTRSGTNTLHGSAYYYERNAALSVVSPFQQGNPPLTNIQLGASLGGPFWKNKTFWFVNFEKQKFNISTGNAGTEPSPAWQKQAQALLDTYGVPTNPAMQSMIQTLWPSNLLTGPATSPNNTGAAPEFGYSNNGVAKLDQIFNDHHSISVRAFLGQGNQTAPVGQTDVNPWYFEIGPIHVYNFSLAYNWVISPTITNQITAGVNYFNQTFSDAKTGFDVDALGFVTNAPFTNAPNLQIAGFEPTGNTPPEGRNDITGHLDEALNWTTGKHTFRFGGEFREGMINEFYFRHSVGNFKFSGTNGPWCTEGEICGSGAASLADFLAGYINNGSIARGDPEREVFITAFDTFAQDTWQLTPTFNLNLGLRYSYVQPMHDNYKDLSVFIPSLGGNGLAFQGREIPTVYPNDWNNISPRVGFSYQPAFSPGVVFRGGVGLFFDTPNANPFLDNRPGNSAPNGFEGNPGGSNPVFTQTASTGYRTTPYVAGTDLFSGTLICTADSQCGVFSTDQNFKNSYNMNFNLQMEKALGSKAIFQLGYVGSEGRHLLSLLNINQPGLGGGPRPFAETYPQYSDINQIESIGTSNYSALQAVFRANGWHGVTTQFSYTWSHNLDEVTQYRGDLPQDSTNFKGDYGNSDFDTRNTFVGFANYDLPSFRGPRLLTQGWQVNGVITIKGGQPITVFSGNDTSGTDEGTQRALQVSNPLKGITHKIISPSDGSAPYVQWLNPDAYQDPAPGTWSPTPRNNVYGPGFNDVDISLFKNTVIRERFNLQFRAEMFNVFNRLNLASPSSLQLGTNYTGSGFATIPSTIGSGNFSPGIGPGEPFNTQLALKLIF
jgi:Carboxypeptidase regulatory-like domain